MSDGAKDIYVYADWIELQTPTLMGCLHAQYVRGQELFSFEFSDEWLSSKELSTLDPDLQLYAGRQYAASAKSAFGLFLDSSPDRWGRQLMQRREAILARNEARPIRKLRESDYLLGLHDITRMGALRFKLDQASEFFNNDFDLPTPPWTSLRELESACRKYEGESAFDDEHDKWLNILLAPGSSLGGARPKANVLDGNGFLWIAKFPSCSDAIDVGAWEGVTHRLAEMFGLNVPVCRVEKFSRNGSTFLSKRFDRMVRKRIHFASAMTLLGRTDGDDYSSGCSYLDLAMLIIQQGVSPDKDLAELWKRIVFSIAVSNTDDHLRNHGFLFTPSGWTLAPAYDINPSPKGSYLSLNISEDDNSLDLDLALSVAPHFRVGLQQAKDEINRVREVVSQWKEIAAGMKIPRLQIEEMASAFCR